MAKSKNEFLCCKCGDGKRMNIDEIKKHLTEVHNINIANTKFSRQLLSHMDGDTWYSSDYEWMAPDGLKFTQHCWNERAKNDPMRFM